MTSLGYFILIQEKWNADLASSTASVGRTKHTPDQVGQLLCALHWWTTNAEYGLLYTADAGLRTGLPLVSRSHTCETGIQGQGNGQTATKLREKSGHLISNYALRGARAIHLSFCCTKKWISPWVIPDSRNIGYDGRQNTLS